MPIRKEIAGEEVICFGTDDNDKASIDATFAEIVAANFGDPSNAPIPIFDNGEHALLLPTGAVLSDRQLRVGLAIGHVVCDPAPNQTQINGSSIDVRLGHYFYHAGRPANGIGIFNPFSEADTLRYFGIEDKFNDYLEAKPWEAVSTSLRREIGSTAFSALHASLQLEGIPDDHPIILLRPGERILGHTHEFIGMRPPGTMQMQARSTTGRIGVSACYDAGWGDPGYINRWTMEILNHNENEYIILPVGFRLAQLAFYLTGPVATEYSLASGNYQSAPSSNLEVVKASWHPSQMIPRAHKNEILLPPPVDGLSGGLR